MGANRTEEGREGVVDERAELRLGNNGGHGLRARFGRGNGTAELEERWERFGVRLGGVGTRGIERGSEGVVGAANGDDHCSLGLGLTRTRGRRRGAEKWISVKINAGVLQPSPP